MTSSPPLPHDPSRTPSNPLGTVGLIVSLVGTFLTCGLLSPVGLLVSLIALRKSPRGVAILGAIIGLSGCILFVAFGLAFVASLVGFHRLGNAVARSATTSKQLQSARLHLDELRQTRGRLPTATEGGAFAATQIDGWGTPLTYEIVATDFIVRSAGIDRLMNTADDLTLGADGVVRGVFAPVPSPVPAPVPAPPAPRNR